MSTLADLIADKRVHVLDGAMGTMLYSRGMFVNVCYDELNLTQPELVQEIHEEYVQAGAEILETNTFGANPVKLSSHGLDDETEPSTAPRSRSPAGGRMAGPLVVGAIGPLGIRLEPWGPTAREEAIGFFSRQVRGLLEGEVDGFILETFSDLHEVEAALCAVKALSDLPVIAQMTVGTTGIPATARPSRPSGPELTELGADVVGLNCSVGPAAMLDALERMVERTDRPLSAQPNAGLPRAVDDRRIYLASPEYMGSYARRMIQAGARFVGGCCGTTPDHIRKIHDYVASLQPRRVSVGGFGRGPAGAAGVGAGAARAALGVGSEARVRRAGDHGGDSSAQGLESRRDDRAVPRAPGSRRGCGQHPRQRPGTEPDGSPPAALIVQREVGLETVFHYTCRDRNMLGMLSDLLGAAAGGLRNVLIVTGDPPAMGPYPDSTAVFDIDSIGLTNLVRRLNQGLDPGGNPIGRAHQIRRRGCPQPGGRPGA